MASELAVPSESLSQYTAVHHIPDQPSSPDSFMTKSSLHSSHCPSVNSPAQLRCTFPSCTAKEEDKCFIGKGATSAYKSDTPAPNALCYDRPCLMLTVMCRRHMDSHTRPYICPYVECPRHTNGFSRRDNLTSHIKIHRDKKKSRSPPISEGASPLGAIGGNINATRRKNLKGMSGQERKRLMNTLLICVELGFEDEDEEENDPENEFDVEGMEEDED
ncbi:hypothetical protein BDD12DRAFT_899917 [Trichophaea hybrida]|nr:hypothetical protein BDD12DRAFT_899917 [Trichophaea hybrida]